MISPKTPVKMNGGRAELQKSPPSPSLPAECVLDSGAVTFPGVFDQNGCPLVLFPAESQSKLTEQLSAVDVSQFIHYCLRLHSIRLEESLVSVVVDLRQASLPIARFIAETLLLLEVHRRIIHSVYIVQPKKRDVLKQLVKLLTPGGSKPHRVVQFRRIFLKEIFELSNYIDRSQLTASLGGYLIYCHQSWVAFVKEIDGFVQDFLSVVSRLPSCVSTLQTLSKQPVPTDLERLQDFCSSSQARFQQLRRDLGLDELLKRCECLLEKLRFPENDPCFQAMAGTVLYSHTALEMLHNYNRITAAVEKVELLWQQVFSRAHIQLQVLSLQRDAQQIEEQMLELMRTQLQSFRTVVAADAREADELWRDFNTHAYTHAVALVRRAEDVLHTFAERLPFSERRRAQTWLDDLTRVKNSLSSTVQHLDQRLKSLSDFHHARQRCQSWYGLVLGERLLQELLWSESGCSSFLRRSPCPEVQELVRLAHLARTVTDPQLQQAGAQLSHRCMTLRRILTCPGAAPLRDLQLALQWQCEYLKDCGMSPEEQHRPMSSCGSLTDMSQWPSVGATERHLSPAAKPPSPSSFDSGFEGAANAQPDLRSQREPLRFLENGVKPLHEVNIESVSDSEDQREELEISVKRDAARASIQIVPTITTDSLNLEIKVKRSATLPKNPWLSLPIDDLESSYTVTITPQPSSSEEPSPMGQLLSSTLTESEGQPGDGDHSLLWDTFDLHPPDSERLGESLGDWVQREQQELEEVEQTLGRVAHIIQEEEDVLAQEVVLDELLRSEDLHKHWPQWTEGHNEMSVRDLAESGVIGLDEDEFQNELLRLDTETVRSSEVCEGDCEAQSPSAWDGPVRLELDRSGILRDLQALEEQITEECEKLEALRCPESARSVPSAPEEERSREQRKKKSSRGRRVVRCSVMERRDLDEEWSCGAQSPDHAPQEVDSLESHSPVTCSTEERVSPEPHDSSSAGRSTPPSGSEAGTGCPAAPDSTQALQDIPSGDDESDMLSGGMLEIADVKDSPSDPEGKWSTCMVAADGVLEGEASSAPESGAFDPGGIWSAPANPLSDQQGIECSLSATESLDSEGEEEFKGVLHTRNNNNNTVLLQETGWDGSCESMRGACTSSNLQTHNQQVSDYKTPIILDTGSGLMKAGFADQDFPSAVFPTVIGRPKYEEVMNSCVEREVYVGHEAQQMRGVLSLKRPIRNGVVHNWDEMEMIWHHAFQQLSAAPEDHPVLLTEAALNPQQNRQRMVELMFEAFSVPLTFVAVQAVLALYASGRTTGVVLDSGDGVSHCVPVFEGYCLPHAIQRFNLAGADVTLQLQKLLLERGVCLRSSAELEIVREMKESCCCVSLDYEADLRSGGSELQYTLPDGRPVTLSSERFRAPEILFRPEMIGRDHYGMHESVFKSILHSDIDLRRTFVGNILLSGGNTLLSGLPVRLQQEIQHLVPADLSTSVCVSSPRERDFSVWSGGATLANLTELSGAWISADEYEEFGPQIVFRKCF